MLPLQIPELGSATRRGSGPGAGGWALSPMAAQPRGFVAFFAFVPHSGRAIQHRRALFAFGFQSYNTIQLLTRLVWHSLCGAR